MKGGFQGGDASTHRRLNLKTNEVTEKHEIGAATCASLMDKGRGQKLETTLSTTERCYQIAGKESKPYTVEGTTKVKAHAGSRTGFKSFADESAAIKMDQGVNKISVHADSKGALTAATNESIVHAAMDNHEPGTQAACGFESRSRQTRQSKRRTASAEKENNESREVSGVEGVETSVFKDPAEVQSTEMPTQRRRMRRSREAGRSITSQPDLKSTSTERIDGRIPRTITLNRNEVIQSEKDQIDTKVGISDNAANLIITEDRHREIQWDSNEFFPRHLLNLYDDFLPHPLSTVRRDSPTGVQKQPESSNFHQEVLVLQFLAVSVPIEVTRVYCTVEFYNFGECTTQCFQLQSSAIIPNEFRTFFSDSSANIQIPKLTLHFITRQQFETEIDTKMYQLDFLRYMEKGNMRIHIIDADSNLPIGTAFVPLKRLIRHDKRMVQITANLDITQAVNISSVERHTGYGVDSKQYNIKDHPNMKEDIIEDIHTWKYGEERKGKLCIRLINAVHELDEKLIVTIPEDYSKTDVIEVGNVQFKTKKLSDFEHDWKSLALLHGKIREIQELNRNSSSQLESGSLLSEICTARLSKDELRKAIFDVGIPLTQRQANDLCNCLYQTFLHEHMHSPEPIIFTEKVIDITCIQAGFDSLIFNSGCSQHEQILLTDLNSKLLSFFASAYGNLDRAWEIISENDEFRQEELLETMKEGNILFEGPKYLLSECLNLMGKNGTGGVPKSRFLRWYSVAVYLKNEETCTSTQSDAESQRKLLRWKRTQMIRRRLEAEGLGSTLLPQADLIIENAQYRHEKYRNEKVSNYLHTSLFSNMILNCSCGQSKYFIYNFENPFENHRVFRVLIPDTDLCLVVDQEELEFLFNSSLVDMNENLCGYLPEKVSVVKDEDLSANTQFYNVWLKSKETITLIFKYRSLDFSDPPQQITSTTTQEETETMCTKSKDILVTFQVKSNTGNHFDKVSGLQVRINKLPCAIDRTFTFYQGCHEIFSKNFLIDQDFLWRGSSHDSSLYAMSENGDLNVISTRRRSTDRDLHVSNVSEVILMQSL
eukprot:669773-Hanusia_phi.AAC.1